MAPVSEDAGVPAELTEPEQVLRCVESPPRLPSLSPPGPGRTAHSSRPLLGQWFGSLELQKPRVVEPVRALSFDHLFVAWTWPLPEAAAWLLRGRGPPSPSAPSQQRSQTLVRFFFCFAHLASEC